MLFQVLRHVEMRHVDKDGMYAATHLGPQARSPGLFRLSWFKADSSAFPVFPSATHPRPLAIQSKPWIPTKSYLERKEGKGEREDRMQGSREEASSLLAHVVSFQKPTQLPGIPSTLEGDAHNKMNQTSRLVS